MNTSTENSKVLKADQNKLYKILFWSLVIIDILIAAGYILYSNNVANNQELTSQIVESDSSKNELQRELNDAAVRLDSLKTDNIQLMKELGKPTKDTTNMTLEEKRFIRLVDSTFMVKDSINKVISFMNDSVELKGLPQDQINNYSKTIDLLGEIKIKMDFNLDNFLLQFLKNDRTQLEMVITKYDKKRKTLDSLSKRLKNLSNFIKIALDIFSEAVSHNIIVTGIKN